MKKTSALALFGMALTLGLTGCQSYSTLRFRPVDTTSQLTLVGVKVLVSHKGGGGIGGGVDGGVTDSHGQIDIKGLEAGDVLTFIKPGYEPASIKLSLNSYSQKSPASSGDQVVFDLRELDAVPVPLHRVGNIVRPTTVPVLVP